VPLQDPVLDNVIWCALSGHQARFSVGTHEARRYAPGFSPIVGFSDYAQPRFDALAPCCQPGERFYCERWTGAAPEGFQIEVESSMVKMLWTGRAPSADEAPDASTLGPEHAASALALAELTNPGPFGLRTIELGEYFGYFEAGQLIAMAGERMHAAHLREISGVCTHPSARGRGLAYRLMRKLLWRELQRAEQPFLHVMSANTRARELYRSMGFVEYLETVVRVVARTQVKQASYKQTET
jgi:ribosomal protein S18 acetylase RimI-like enzyme